MSCPALCNILHVPHSGERLESVTRIRVFEMRNISALVHVVGFSGRSQFAMIATVFHWYVGPFTFGHYGLS
jgi:hypothetical protein